MNIPPSHENLADYLRWAIDQAQRAAPGLVTVHASTRVTSARVVTDQWTIEAHTTSGRHSRGGFDGLVVTSPGPGGSNDRYHVDPAVTDRVLDAQSYWSRTRLPAGPLAVDRARRIAILGAGGAAAAIALDIFSHRPAGLVAIIAPQPAFFTRGESPLETELLTTDRWAALPGAVRRTVAERLVAGVVFQRVMRELDASLSQPDFLLARALAVYPSDVDPTDPDAQDQRVELCCRTLGDKVMLTHAAYVVDATGFDALWFRELLDPLTSEVLKRLGPAFLADRLDAHLRLVVARELPHGGTLDDPLIAASPALHAPLLAGGSQAPSLGSLLQLGEMAARVVEPYLA